MSKEADYSVKQYRCSNASCNRRLFDVDLKEGRIEVVCKCGTKNILIAEKKQKTDGQAEPSPVKA